MWESLFIEVSGFLNKKIIFGNIFTFTFLAELSPILINVQISKHEVVIAGDFNIELLNIRGIINVS